MTHEPRESLSSKIIAPLLVVVIGAILVGGSAPWWWEVICDPCARPDVDAHRQADDALRRDPSTDVSPTNCAIRRGMRADDHLPIRDHQREPSHASPAAGDVPPGDYPTADTRIVNWGDRDERWFEITASGRTGWIVYSKILVDAKSSECP